MNRQRTEEFQGCETTSPVDDILEGFLTLGQCQNQVLLTFCGRCVATRGPGPLPVPAVWGPEPRRPPRASQGTDAQQVSAIDGGTGAASFVDRVNLVQPLFQEPGLFLLHRKQRWKRALRDKRPATSVPQPCGGGGVPRMGICTECTQTCRACSTGNSDRRKAEKMVCFSLTT